MFKLREAVLADAKSIVIVNTNSLREIYRNLMTHPRDLDYNDPTEEEVDEYEYRLKTFKLNVECFFVAEIDSKEIVGYAYAGRPNNSERRGVPINYLSKMAIFNEIFVLPNHQAEGIGTSLFKEIANCLVQKGYNSLILRAYPKSPALVKVMKAQAKCKKAW